MEVVRVCCGGGSGGGKLVRREGKMRENKYEF
jgi:hypothetical protein